MAMGDALASEFLRTGAVLLDHRHDFPGNPKPKFLVLFEDYDGSRETTIAAFTTTNKKVANYQWVVALSQGQGSLPKNCFLDCNSCLEYPTLDFTTKTKYRYIGQLPEDVVDGAFDALEFAHKVPPHLIARIWNPE